MKALGKKVRKFLHWVKRNKEVMRSDVHCSLSYDIRCFLRTSLMEARLDQLRIVYCLNQLVSWREDEFHFLMNCSLFSDLRVDMFSHDLQEYRTVGFWMKKTILFDHFVKRIVAALRELANMYQTSSFQTSLTSRLLSHACYSFFLVRNSAV